MPRASTGASMMPTPAGKAAGCGAPTAIARRGGWKAAKAASRGPCTSSCGPIRWRTESGIESAETTARRSPSAPGGFICRAVCRRARAHNQRRVQAVRNGIDFGLARLPPKQKTLENQENRFMPAPTARLALVALACAVAAPASAQLLQRKDLSYPIALTIAQAALDDCKARGYATSVVVVDRGGNTVVALRADNASAHTMENARRKAYTAMTFKMTTAEFIKDMATRPVRREQTTLPNVIAIDGGVPLKVGNDVIGGVGLSGSPGIDEQCVMAGVNKVKDQLQ